MTTLRPLVHARLALLVAGALFAVFAANVLLAAFRVHLSLPVGPFLPRVPEFLVLFLSCLTFAVATLLRERARRDNETESK